MSNRLGYKHTPLGWIPGEWEISAFERMCSSLVRGPFGGALKKEIFTDTGYKVYEQRNAIYKDCQIGNYFIDNEKFSELKRFSVEPGNFLVSCSGTIGKIYKVPPGAPKGIINQALLKIVCDNKKVEPEFFNHYFEWQGFQKRIIDNSQGGAMQNLVGMELFKQVPCSLPPILEQRKIAAILSTWDEAITKTQQFIAQLQQRNKVLMQQLLTGKRRLIGFSEPWKAIHLAEAFNERNETGNINLNLLSVGSLGVYPQSQSEKRDTSNSDKTKYKRICPGDIGYNTMRMWQGRSALSNLEGIVSPAYTIVTPKERQHSEFYACLFKLPSVVNKFFRNSQGLVEDTLNCKFKDFSIVKVEVPEYEEQVAIANVLTTAQLEVKAYEEKLFALQQQKKGLMQKLLTGEVRVKIED